MSSYLLAKIALETLGFKFDDVDGDLAPIDGTIDFHNTQLVTSEPNNGTLAETLDAFTEEGSALPADIQSNWPSVRIKLLDAECAKVKRQLEQEIFHSKAALKQNYRPLSPCDDNTSEEIQKLIYQEKLKLDKYKQTVKNFRKVAEKKLIYREQSSKP